MRKKGAGRKRRLVLEMDESVIRALKARAAMEGTTVSKLVEEWVRSWAKAPSGR
jgi:hypothetical protein